MKKLKNLRIYIIILTLAGMLSSLLPWSGIYMGSIPPGNIPNKIYYGYEKNGLLCLILFAIILCISIFTIIRKEPNKKLKIMSIISDICILAICLFDILKIKIKYRRMVGAVPFIGISPFIMSFVSIIILILVSANTKNID